MPPITLGVLRLLLQPLAGTVCSSSTRTFGSYEASAACRALGFMSGTADTRTCGTYSYSSYSRCSAACTSGSRNDCELGGSGNNYYYRCCSVPSWMRTGGWFWDGAAGVWVWSQPVLLSNVWCPLGTETSLQQVGCWALGKQWPDAC